MRKYCQLFLFSAVLLMLTTVHAENLLEGARIMVASGTGAADAVWVPVVKFDKPGNVKIRLKVEFEVKSTPSSQFLSLTKPEGFGVWSINGQPLMTPPVDMIFTQVDGIASSLIKTGTNTLEGCFLQKVDQRFGFISPRSTSGYKFELKPADIKDFEIRTGPILGAAGYDYFTVGCRTRMPAAVTLECDGRSWTSNPGLVHRFKADGLKEGVEYEYKLVARLEGGTATAESKLWKVRTLTSKGPLTFAALGDARSNPKIWGSIAAEVLRFKPQFILHTGDIVVNGNDYEIWDTQFASPAGEFLATIPCFYTFGNHENNVSMLDMLFGFPGGKRNYSQVIGPVQVFAMDRSSNWGKGSTNLVTMEKELSESTAEFILAFTHPPAWSSGAHGNDILGKDVHFPILERYGVTALIAGHDHCYERLEPGNTTMLITGGGGATLYRQTNKSKNPHSKIFRSEFNFLIFNVDDKQCEMKAYAFGDDRTPDARRKVEEIDKRVWKPRKAGVQKQKYDD